MIGIKKFGFYILALLLVPVGFYAIKGQTSGPGEVLLNNFDAQGLGWVLTIVFPILLLIMFAIRRTTKCPQCKKSWVGKRLSNEDLGASSGVFSKKSGDTYHQYEKHKHRLSYQCTSCGHEWQKIVERDHQLD